MDSAKKDVYNVRDFVGCVHMKPEVGLYKVTMSFSADGKTVSSVSCGSRIELPMTTDLEAVAYDPASGNV